MNFLEKSGCILGYPLGAVTGTISFLRASRMFHPKGIIALARVENLKPDLISFHPNVLVRFTSAMWKYKTWPDVLGITMRFSQEENFTERHKPLDQDLLCVSFPHPWQTPIGPFLTNFRNFFSNTYYAVSPFSYQEDLWIFRLTLEDKRPEYADRSQHIRENIQNGGVIWLWMKQGKEDWIRVSRITLLKEVFLDQEKLYFNPFQNGLNLHPRGFVHHLRIGSYRASQAGRSFRYAIQKIFHHVHNRLIIHRL